MFYCVTEDGTPQRKPSKMWTSRNVTFNMDCFPGAGTSVDTDMTHDSCEETTIQYDTVLHDMMGSPPDFEQADVADETIPNTGHLDDEDDNTAAEERTRATAEECQTASTTR